MSGIIIAHRSLPAAPLDAAIRRQEAAGFRVALDRQAGAWRLVGLAPLLEHMPAPLFTDEGPGFAFASGTFFYGGRWGHKALGNALHDWRNGSFDAGRAEGHFALLIGNDAHFELLTDTLPSNRIYVDRERRMYANLLLPMLYAQHALTPDPQGVYEYAWLHANHGTSTPFREIRAIEPGESVEFHDEQPRHRPAPPGDWLTPDLGDMSFDNISRHFADALAETLAPTITAFGNRVKTALSGGYDSRLIAAGLMQGGCEASYYVYGAKASADRRVASAIAERFGLDFSAVEKPDGVQLDAAAYREHLERKTQVFDGSYVDGLFDNGVDLPDRISRLRNTDILLIGSGGEALRNFFYLPEGRYTPAQLVSTFYSTYDPAACTAAFDEGGFRRTLAQRLAGDIGVDPDQPADRARIELAYPLFRVRYWSTREIAVNQRIGWTLYPYLYPRMIAGTPTIPLHWKNHGLLEGGVIRSLSPGLAEVPSDYGFAFDGHIPLAYRAKMQLTYRRPPWLRRFSYQVQMRMRRQAPQWPDAGTLATWMDPGLPQMSEFFKVGRIMDGNVLNRAATLEYLLNHHREFRQQLAR